MTTLLTIAMFAGVALMVAVMLFGLARTQLYYLKVDRRMRNLKKLRGRTRMTIPGDVLAEALERRKDGDK